jgi:hypothetical protein
MAPELALGGLQRWMQSLIVHPGPVDEAVASPEAASLVRPDRLAEVLLPSATLTPTERIGIYHGMYILRMVEALESDYPALAHFLGEKRWAALVRDYVERHPSRSHTLNVLGRALPSFLLETSDLPRRGFCHDLARLELAVTEVFDAEETPRLGEAELLSVPAEAWDGARLVPSAALRLLKLGWNANEWLDSTKGDRHEHPRPRRRATRIAVFRQGYAVYRRELGLSAYRLLADLVAGLRIGEALAAARRRRGAPGPEALTRWFRDWAADGAFTRIELPARVTNAWGWTPGRRRRSSASLRRR